MSLLVYFLYSKKYIKHPFPPPKKKLNQIYTCILNKISGREMNKLANVHC